MLYEVMTKAEHSKAARDAAEMLERLSFSAIGPTVIEVARLHRLRLVEERSRDAGIDVALPRRAARLHGNDVDLDPAALLHGGDGVIENVEKNLLQLSAIARDGGQLGFDLEAHSYNFV